MSNTSPLRSEVTYIQDGPEVYLYPIIDSYFDRPVLEKTKDSNNLSVYMCKIASLLAGAEQRYLVVTTVIDRNPVGTRVALASLKWKSFQARTIPQYIPSIPKHSYSPKSTGEYLTPVHLSKRYEDHTEYSLEGYPTVAVTLLHKNKNMYEYAEKGMVATALETFRCVFVVL
jgi:hypothetical protein